jgi:hypothetical protein
MKALMATAAVVVIATCGYFVYEDRQSKAVALEKAEASERRQKYISCRDQLKETAEFTGSTSGETMEEISSRLIMLLRKSESEAVTKLMASVFENLWEECGPI